MTLDQFYVALAKKTKRTHTQWGVTDLDEIRVSGHFADHCPLSFVANGRPCEVLISAHMLGLRQSTAEKIAWAADEAAHSRHRSRLLEACGLETW